MVLGKIGYVNPEQIQLMGSNFYINCPVLVMAKKPSALQLDR